MTRRPACLLPLLLLLVVTVGCGRSGDGSAGPPAPTATAPVMDETACASSPPGQVLAVTTAGESIPVELIGAGAVTVILSNQSDRDRCAWLGFATVLVSHGFAVAWWDYAAAPAADELSAIAFAVHADRGGTEVLMGASKGAKTSLIAARRLAGSFVAGVVSLSAEAILQPGIDVASAVAGLTVPTLLVTADEDPYGSAEAIPEIGRGLTQATMMRVPGSDHGIALLAEPAVASAVLGFLTHLAATPR